MFSEALLARAEDLLAALRGQGRMLATAESCTGGLIAALFTEIPGSSDVFERGFITYSNTAKMQMLGVPRDMLDTYGAVSEQVARAMAQGALAHSQAAVAVAVTGIAGPGGGSADKPVGLVHIAAGMIVSDGARLLHRECRFGAIGRDAVRLKTVDAALDLVAALT